MKIKKRICVVAAAFALFASRVQAADLTIVHSGDQVFVSWPQAVTSAFYLQSAKDFSSQTVWSNGSDPTTNASDLVVVDMATNSTRFYRLKAWEVLFDGTSTTNFRGYKQAIFPGTNIWRITTNKELMAVAVTGGASIRTNDLITFAQYDNFELRWEWKAATNSNSGVVIRVTEPSETNNFTTQTGPEYQLLDDLNGAADATIPNRSMASVYGLFAPTNKVLVPVGQWNYCRLTVRSNHVEQWLNGGKVVQYEINGPGWTQAVANSPSSPMPGFAETTPASIVLQHHGQQCWFRNAKIRRLSSP